MAKQTRSIQDALLSVSVALPNAANTVNTNVIDLGSTQPFPATEGVAVRVTSGLSTGANSKNINIVLQHTNESNGGNAVNFSNVMVVAGNAANFPLATFNIALPPDVRQYIRASATGEANGGNAADGNLTAQVVF